MCLVLTTSKYFIMETYLFIFSFFTKVILFKELVYLFYYCNKKSICLWLIKSGSVASTLDYKTISKKNTSLAMGRQVPFITEPVLLQMWFLPKRCRAFSIIENLQTYEIILIKRQFWNITRELLDTWHQFKRWFHGLSSQCEFSIIYDKGYLNTYGIK